MLDGAHNAASAEALRRFATGCYAAWYPIKDEAAVEGFMAAFATLPAAN